MGNNRSRVAPTRSSRIIDSHTRARYQNQRELIQLRRKLTNITMKHDDNMARLACNRHDIRIRLHKIQHETAHKELLKKLDKLKQENSTLSINESVVFDESDESTLECSSLLLHNLNASDEWNKSIILPDNSQSSSSIPSKFDTSYNSFEQTESVLLNDSLSLKQHTEQMKKAVKIAIARSIRDSKIIARRDGLKY